MDKSLWVTYNGNEIFVSKGKWLHPLFELSDFLSKNDIPSGEVFLTDKIAGKAAAFLMVRIGIKKAHIQLISEGAIEVYKRFGVGITYTEKVPAIQCKTEQIVSLEMPVEEVWQMLRRRAGRVLGIEVAIDNLQVLVEKKMVLKDINLHLSKGENIVINGPNGAGKSTLLKSIIGIVPIHYGTITLHNIDIRSNEWRALRNMVGYVAQNKVESKFPISAGEVVAIGLANSGFSTREIRHRVEIAMRRTGCFHLIKRSFHELSGGEQQRVSIARCLCQQARLLLFDEPTSFLDAYAKNELTQLLYELWQNEAPTMIIVSHDELWVSQFKWPIYQMNEGCLC